MGVDNPFYTTAQAVKHTVALSITHTTPRVATHVIIYITGTLQCGRIQCATHKRYQTQLHQALSTLLPEQLFKSMDASPYF